MILLQAMNRENVTCRAECPTVFRLKNGILLLVVFGCATSIAHGQDDSQFPYQALILNENATIRSGPGEVHYPTNKLSQGDVVDVYRHDPGGWCAIRPPDGCFSLVPASAVEILESNIGIVKDDVQAWVGTRLGSVDRPLWQVKLKTDERVEILGEVSWPNPEGHSTIWYQISPPAGEFRWIQMSDLQLPSTLTELPEVAANIGKTVSAEFIQSSNARSDSSSGADPIALAGMQSFDAPVLQPSTNDQTINAGWRKATEPFRPKSRLDTSGPTDSFQVPAIDDAQRSDEDSKLNARRESGPVARVANANIAPALPTPDPNPIAPAGSKLERQATGLDELSTSPAFPSLDISTIGPTTKKISDLEMMLTREMLRSPNEWRLTTLEDQALAIKESTSDPQEKLHADRLVEKIRRCEKIRGNYELTYESNEKFKVKGGVGFNGLQSDEPVGTGVDTELRHSTTYDAYGWLNELVSNRSEDSAAPTFVLEDDNGRIIYHVSPAPGLNLHRYLKSKVGIIGQRGYHRRLQLSHVTAERVIVLEKIR